MIGLWLLLRSRFKIHFHCSSPTFGFWSNTSMELKTGEPEASRKRPHEEEALVEISKDESNGGEMELRISAILEKMERFTNHVSELLESGKSMFKEMSNEFEDRIIAVHKQQMEKWSEEMKELRSLDSSNEEANALLRTARLLLQPDCLL